MLTSHENKFSHLEDKNQVTWLSNVHGKINYLGSFLRFSTNI